MENLSSQTLAITLVVAIFVAILTEVVKAFDKGHTLNANMINLMTLWLGWLGAMLCMWAFQGDFVTYTFMGLSAGVLSPGIYEYVKNTLGG